jgi:outer membrane protein TolC
MFLWGNPTYALSLQLTLPVRSRTASMTMANALIAKKSDALTLRTQQQAIRLSVLNALTALQSAKDQLKLNQTAANYAQLNYQAKVLEYSLGATTELDVVQGAQTLSGALQQVVTSEVAVRDALISLYVQTGELLDRHGVVIR